MKKRIISLLLTLTMLLTLMPSVAFARPTQISNTDFTDWTKLTQDSFQNGALTITGDCKYYLGEDVTGNITINQNGTLALDLNGYVLKGTGSGSVITVSGKLTIRDSSPDLSHSGSYESLPVGGVITGGNAKNGGGIFINSNACATILGGTIYDNKAASNGGGIYGSADSQLLIKGCKLTKNYATIYGGAICMIGGEATNPTDRCVLLNTNITANSAETSGGGVYFAKTIKGDECVAVGTLITMSDGSTRKIEDISEGDIVKTFDHEKGCISESEVYYAFKGDTQVLPFSLCFEDGLNISVVGCHDFFEQNSLKYVTLTEDNASDYIGKCFYGEDGEWHKLLNVTKGSTPCDYYSIYTAEHQNCFANGLLSCPDDVDHLLNIYKLDEDLKADEQQLAADIAEYGLASYEYAYGIIGLSREWYDAASTKYLFVAIGKRLITQDKAEKLYTSTIDSAEEPSQVNASLPMMMSAPMLASSAPLMTTTENETSDTILGNYGKGVLTIGSGTKIIDNTVGNVFLANYKDNNDDLPSLITLDGDTRDDILVGVMTETAPKKGSNIQFTTNGTKADEAFFFPDRTSDADIYNSVKNYLELTVGFTVTESKCANGSVSVGYAKSYYYGETVNISAVPDVGSAVDKVYYRPKDSELPIEIIPTDGKYTFTMPNTLVTVSATFTKSAVAQVINTDGDVISSHDSVQAAINNVGAGTSVETTKTGTVKMISNSVENVTVSQYQNITLDLNGMTLKSTGTVEGIRHNAVTNKGTLTIKDSSTDGSGKITGGTGTIKGRVSIGGGVYNSMGSLTITGGTITGNSAGLGGGVANVDNGTLIITGGTVTGNNATTNGGGVFNEGKMIIGGRAIISSNKTNDQDNNLYCKAPITISIDTPLTIGANVGVTLESGKGQLTTNGAESDMQYFFSDSLAYKLSFVGATTEPAAAAHLELADYTISAVASDTSVITLENDSMTSAQAIAIAKAQKPNTSLGKETVIAYAKGDSFTSDGKYLTVTASSASDWASGTAMTLKEMKDAMAAETDSKNAFVIGTVSSHAHSWTYTASKSDDTLTDNDTLTATCSTGCTATDNTLILKASDVTYDGNTHSALRLAKKTDTIEAASFCGSTTLPTISYEKKDGDNWVTFSGTPKAVGTYRASITVGTDTAAKTAYAQFSINKATPAITTNPTASAITYGQTLSNSTISNGVASVSGSFTWDDGTKAPTVSDSNTMAYKVIFTPEDTANYNTAECYVKLTVNKATPTITKKPTASLITYGKKLSDSTLSNGAASVNGTFAWKVPTTAPAVSDSNNTEYTVVFTPNDTANYNSVECAIKLTVNKATPTYSAPTGLTATYGQTLADITLGTGFTWVEAATTSVGNAGSNTFHVKYTPSDTANYNIVDSIEVTVSVNKATPTITKNPTASLITYGKKLSDSTLSNGAASVNGTFAWKVPTTAPAVSDSNNTEYTVVFTPNDTANYNSVECAIKLTVNKATPTYSAPTGLTATYGQTLADITLGTGFTWVEAATTSVGNAGSNTFHVKYTPSDTANYNIVDSIEVTVSVNKATPTITKNPTASLITYGKKLSDSTLSNGAASVNGTFAWKVPTTAPAVSDSNNTEYTVVFTPNDTANYNSVECAIKLTVNKAASSVNPVPTAKTLTYSGAAQELVNAGTAVNGLMYYSIGTVSTHGSDWSASIPKATNTGTYYVWYKCVGGANYKDTEPQCIEVSIAKKSIEGAVVTLDGFVFYADGTEKTQTVAAVEIDGITLAESDYTVTENTATAAGTYTLKVNAKDDSSFCGTVAKQFVILSKPVEKEEPVGRDEETKVTINGGEVILYLDNIDKAPTTWIEMSPSELIDAAASAEDLYEVSVNGASLKIWMEVTPATDMTPEIKKSLDTKMDSVGKHSCCYLDADLFSQLTTNEGGSTNVHEKNEIHETASPLTVTVTVPSQYWAANRKFLIVRFHDNESTVIEAQSYDPETGLLTFASDKFSEYALGFEYTGYLCTNETKESGIRNGSFNMYVDSINVGTATIQKANGGWYLNVGGKDIGRSGSSLSTDKQVWKFEYNKFYQEQTVEVSRGWTILNLLFGRKKVTTTYYLAVDGNGKLCINTSGLDSNVELTTVSGLFEHNFVAVPDGIGKHCYACSCCGERNGETGTCSYDENGICTICGAQNPKSSGGMFKISVKTHTTNLMFFKIYTAQAVVTSDIVGIKSVKISNGGALDFTTGKITSTQPIKDVIVLITTYDNNSYAYKYNISTGYIEKYDMI